MKALSLISTPSFWTPENLAFLTDKGFLLATQTFQISQTQFNEEPPVEGAPLNLAPSWVIQPSFGTTLSIFDFSPQVTRIPNANRFGEITFTEIRLSSHDHQSEVASENIESTEQDSLTPNLKKQCSDLIRTLWYRANEDQSYCGKKADRLAINEILKSLKHIQDEDTLTLVKKALQQALRAQDRPGLLRCLRVYKKEIDSAAKQNLLKKEPQNSTADLSTNPRRKHALKKRWEYRFSQEPVIILEKLNPKKLLDPLRKPLTGKQLGQAKSILRSDLHDHCKAWIINQLYQLTNPDESFENPNNTTVDEFLCLSEEWASEGRIAHERRTFLRLTNSILDYFKGDKVYDEDTGSRYYKPAVKKLLGEFYEFPFTPFSKIEASLEKIESWCRGQIIASGHIEGRLFISTISAELYELRLSIIEALPENEYDNFGFELIDKIKNRLKSDRWAMKNITPQMQQDLQDFYIGRRSNFIDPVPLPYRLKAEALLEFIEHKLLQAWPSDANDSKRYLQELALIYSQTNSKLLWTELKRVLRSLHARQ